MLSGLQQDDEAIQNEIFGPVITVQRFTDEAEALALGQRRRLRPRLQSVWTKDFGRAMRMSQGARLRLRLDQHAHPARRRDAARRLQEVRLRQGPVDVRLRGLHPHQARHGQHRAAEPTTTRPRTIARAQLRPDPAEERPLKTHRSSRRPASPATSSAPAAALAAAARAGSAAGRCSAPASWRRCRHGARPACAPPEPPVGAGRAQRSSCRRTCPTPRRSSTGPTGRPYLDVYDEDDKKYPTLEAFIEAVRHQGQLHRGHRRQRLVLRQGRARSCAPARTSAATSSRCTDWMAARLIRDQLVPAARADPDAERGNLLPAAQGRLLRPGPAALPHLAERLRRHRLQQGEGRPRAEVARRPVDRRPQGQGRRALASSATPLGLVMHRPGRRHRRATGQGGVRDGARRHRAEDRATATSARSRATPTWRTSPAGNAVAGIAWSGDIFVLACRDRGRQLDRSPSPSPAARSGGQHDGPDHLDAPQERRDAHGLLLRPGGRGPGRGVGQLRVSGRGRPGRDGEDRPRARREPVDLPDRRVHRGQQHPGVPGARPPDEDSACTPSSWSTKRDRRN